MLALQASVKRKSLCVTMSKQNILTALRAVKYVLFLLLVTAVTLVFLPETSVSNNGAEVSLEEQETTTLRPTHSWTEYRCEGVAECWYKSCEEEGTECHPGDSTPCLDSEGESCGQ